MAYARARLPTPPRMPHAPAEPRHDGGQPPVACTGALAGPCQAVPVPALCAAGPLPLLSLPQRQTPVRFLCLWALQINLRMSLVGVVLLTLYQALHTWPRRHELVLGPTAASQLSLGFIAAVHGAFGALFSLHSLAQVRACLSGQAGLPGTH